MTDNQKVEMFSMRLKGHTLQEIGDKCGMSRERVRQILNYAADDSKMVRARKRIVFKNIASWLSENDVSIGDFAIMIGYKDSPSCQHVVSKLLRGEQELRHSTIDKILEVTGMKYEDAFERAESTVDDYES